MNRMLTLIAASALVLGALAVPVMAEHNDRHGSDASERDAKRDDRREKMDERREKMEERREAMKERHEAMKERIEERREAFREAREACKEAFKQRNGTDNGTQAPGRCISMAAHDHHHKEVRAAHYLEKHIAAIEHRLERLDAKEARVQAAIDSGELNETELAAAEAKLERIDAWQAKLQEKLAALQERLAALQADVAEVEEEELDDVDDVDEGSSEDGPDAEPDASGPDGA